MCSHGISARPIIDESKLSEESKILLEETKSGDARAPILLARELIKNGGSDQEILELLQIGIDRGSIAGTPNAPAIAYRAGREDLAISIAGFLLDSGVNDAQSIIDLLFDLGAGSLSNYSGILRQYQLARHVSPNFTPDRFLQLAIQPGRGVDYEVYDIEEELPFNKGKEYKKTGVRCNYTGILFNRSATGVAFRNPFLTVLGVRFSISGDQSRNHIIQGNVGMSVANSEHIIESGSGTVLDFVSMVDHYESSHELAEQWAQNGGCSLSNVSNIQPAGIHGDIMWEDLDQWEGVNDNLLITVYDPENDPYQ